ncbi:MAG: nascent polypeptide-associated complex protein, partial [Candidatus Micrarchaeia archaeon]
MMPNLDPKALKSMMDRLGIKSSELNATKVTIELKDKEIVVENPQVMLIEAQGMKSFQITGNITENEKQEKVEVKDEDIEFVIEQTGIKDRAQVKAALEKA